MPISRRDKNSQPPIHVLLVEDNPDYAGLVRTLLARSPKPKFNVTSIVCLTDLLTQLDTVTADVILLDMTLPDSNGIDTLRRAMALAAQLPIVILTGHDDERLAVQALQEGAQDYLVKGQNETVLLTRAIQYAIERKRGQTALQASDARFRHLIEKNADPIIIIDRHLIVRFANPAVAELFGEKGENMTGTVFGFPLPQPDETSEIEIIDSDGRLAVAEMRVVPCEWEHEDAYLASLRDITEHKRMLTELEQTRQQDLRMKDVFLSKVSHELRSPLSVIHQFTTILLDELTGELNPEQREGAEIIFRNVEELRNMIDDLLQVAREEINEIFKVSRNKPGNINVVSECVQVGDLLRETLGMLRAISTKKLLTLTETIDSPLPPAHADPNRIRQVLNNLINNAIKYTPNSGNVHVSAGIDQEKPDFIRVCVEDNGPGISPDEKEKIFEYLYQSDSAIDDSRKGLGIGLYICREIVERHGGSIWVDPISEGGSRFTFTLPIFSLEKLVTPILSSRTIAAGDIGFIVVEVLPKEHRPLTSQDEKVMSEIWQILKHCILPDFDLVLPRIGRFEYGEVFFIMACSPPNGIDALIRRIQGQLRLCDRLMDSDLGTHISPAPLETKPTSTNPPHEHQSMEIVERLKKLIDLKVFKRPESKKKEI